MVAAWSAPSLACSWAGPTPYDFGITFANQTVPRNAELWINGAFQAAEASVELVDGDGVHVAARIELIAPDSEHGRLVPDRPLSTGQWTLRFSEPAFGEATFTVADGDDDEAPAAPVVERHFGGPLDFIGACSSEGIVDVNTTDGDVARVVVNEFVYVMPVEGELSFMIEFGQRDEDLVISLVDHAGNESEAVIAGAGGCASVPAAPMSMLASVLLFIRRRRPEVG